VDASATHIRACLQQKGAGSPGWELLGFFSKKLEPAQVKYSPFDWELLVCFLGIRHFWFMLEGRAFTIYTGHKPLTTTINRGSIPVPEQRFTHLHVYLVGPLPTSAEGFKYLFTIIDWSTRWVEAIPVKNMEMATIADALVAGWVSHFGVLAVITSDRGTQFISAVWEVLCKRLNIQHITTTAFHTCSNGMVERCHCQLKDLLWAR
jgi:hypothetical protein